MTKKRRYSDEERANALALLAANANNVSLTARQLGIPRCTLRLWFVGLRHPEALVMSQNKKIELAVRFEDMAHTMLDHANTCVEELDAKEAVTSAAICVDKMRLLRDQPTDISRQQEAPDFSEFSDEELAEYERLQAKLHRSGRDSKGTGP